LNSFELREEIDHGGRVYFLQTSYVPDTDRIKSSFFKNGVLFDTVVHEINEKISPNELKSLTKEVHLHNKGKLQALLRARDKVKNFDSAQSHLKLAEALFRRNLFVEAIQECELALKKGNDNSR